MVIMVILLILIILSIILSFKQNNSHLFDKNHFDYNIEYINEINKKIKIANMTFGNIEMNMNVLSVCALALSIIFSIIISLLFDFPYYISFLISLIFFVIIFINLIDKNYENKKKNIESQILNIGLIVKQLVALKRPTDVIVKTLSESSNDIVASEFKEIYVEYLTSYSIISSLDTIKKKYPNSMLNTLILLLKIYTKHEKDISDEISNLIKEVESIERIKKKIEVEFIKQDKNITSLVIISFLFTVSFIYMNTSYREFYSSKSGIVIMFAVLIYELIGFGLIWFFKSLIIKNKRLKRINLRKENNNENIIR